MITRVASLSATTSAIRGSCTPVVSLITCAPATMLALATSGSKVSTEITTPAPRSAATTGTTRSISSVTGTAGPGANLAPPMSTQSAPSATACRAAATAFSSAKVAPRS
nr:hypothetical protein BJQ95_03590 [Cryobacterium sp. SO1]